MFGDSKLLNHIQTSSSLDVRSKLFAEWNLNSFSNIEKIGNYRHRPSVATDKYHLVPVTYDPQDIGGYYTDATDADITIDGGFDNSNNPISIVSKKIKTNLLYSLEDCFGKFRPRSGINKATYITGRYLHHTNKKMYARPRYYMADKNDKFKYWTSFRTESGVDRGLSFRGGNTFYIEDAAPFVVYKSPIPTNRIVVKMQTHVGTDNLGPFYTATSQLDDPFYGYSNSRTPLTWKIQYLEAGQWKTATDFTPTSARADGTPIIGPDGYVEIYYGLNVPSAYKTIFNFKSEIISTTMLPINPKIGDAYLVKVDSNDIGIFYIYTSTGFKSFTPSYGWQLLDGDVIDYRNTITKNKSPYSYKDFALNRVQYRQYKEIQGIRIVVSTMNKNESSFDLIEMSPRMFVDMTEYTESFQVTKAASDLGVSGMPVSQLLASTGKATLFDFDNSFNPNTKDSVIGKYLSQSIKFMAYEQINHPDGTRYLIPIKHLYSHNVPQWGAVNRSISFELRDYFSVFENQECPDLLMQDVSLSVAISTLLDSVGFSNYKFYRTAEDKDLIIPYFFVNKDKSVAQILQDLAVASQSSMFFDEENNFIIMSKNYMMPTKADRGTDFIVSGEQSGLVSANIEDLSTSESKIFNDGSINYKNYYIQKTTGSIKQQNQIDEDRTWVYKAVELWAPSGGQNVKAENDNYSNASSYTLLAVPLNSDLTDAIPTVENNKIINNVMDLGTPVLSGFSRYNGYWYANGEIIKYDAIEYNTVDGPVWVQNAQEYGDYFSRIPFGGSMYPTGKVRIFCEPYYETVNGVTRFKNGAVAKHGRMQFGTGIRKADGSVVPPKHSSGLSNEWQSASFKGCKMSFGDMLDSKVADATTKSKGITLGASGLASSKVASSTKSGIVRNFMSATYLTDKQTNTATKAQKGSVQASALVLEGPAFAVEDKPSEYLAYVPKQLDTKFVHFGTRLRLIGKKSTKADTIQTPNGSMSYFSDASVGASSGGLVVLNNPDTNAGYYFEVMALTKENLDIAGESTPINNIVFYKVKGGTEATSNPIKLWEGAYPILIDTGNFIGQERMYAQDNPTTYDLAVEYKDVAGIRKFYLSINGSTLAIVDDSNPLPVYTNFGPFIRGTSRLMFENLYALTQNHALNSMANLETPMNAIFADDTSLQTSEVLRKYSMSGAIQQTYLSGISTSQDPLYNLYYEEFGTIMREAAYFNVRFDKAYPALLSRPAPVITGLRGYTISGYRPSAYGAEFMIFNATDTILDIGEQSSNYLKINGVSFTQNSERTLTVDDVLSKNSDLSNIDNLPKNIFNTPEIAKNIWTQLKESRTMYGKQTFQISSPYIQTTDEASSLMSWMLKKISKKRKNAGMSIFGGSVLQLGDIVQVFWTDDSGADQIIDRNSRFVVYHIEYEVSSDGPSTTVYISEVTE
jgi:hypothetical protein